MIPKLLDLMVGETCWHVSRGGVTAPSFLLALGDRIPRARPLKNPTQPKSFRLSRGSVELLIWSSWRLQTSDSVLATSDQCEHGVAILDVLLGLAVTDIDCFEPAWDLRICFSEGKELVTFSDHLEPNASIASNWELWASGRHLTAGPGVTLDEESQE
jgi:hypothetical protein